MKILAEGEGEVGVKVGVIDQVRDEAVGGAAVWVIF